MRTSWAILLAAVTMAGSGCKDDKRLLAPVCREALARGESLLRAADVEHARDSLDTARSSCGPERAAEVAALDREIEVVAARRAAAVASASASVTAAPPKPPAESLAPRFVEVAARYRAEAKREVCTEDVCEGVRDVPVPGARRVQVGTLKGKPAAFHAFYSLPTEHVGCSAFGAIDVATPAPGQRKRRCVMKGGALDGLPLLVVHVERDTDVTLYSPAWLGADPDFARELESVAGP